MLQMFRTVQVPIPANDPTRDIALEPVARGRAGAVVAWRDGDRVPLVRGTTRYMNTTCTAPQALRDLARAIEVAANVTVPFNNALVERYTNQYRNMKPHSDQAQDLQANSVIAVWSWYRNPDKPPSRAIRVRRKNNIGSIESTEYTENTETVVPLVHGHAVVFDLAFNAAHVHRITINNDDNDGNDWTGVTLRTSDQYLHTHDGHFVFSDGRPLRLASIPDEKLFFAARKRENHTTDFRWPLFDFTASPGDMIV